MQDSGTGLCFSHLEYMVETLLVHKEVLPLFTAVGNSCIWIYHILLNQLLVKGI